MDIAPGQIGRSFTALNILADMSVVAQRHGLNPTPAERQYLGTHLWRLRFPSKSEHFHGQVGID